jgi:hypothetical protein
MLEVIATGILPAKTTWAGCKESLTSLFLIVNKPMAYMAYTVTTTVLGTVPKEWIGRCVHDDVYAFRLSTPPLALPPGSRSYSYPSIDTHTARCQKIPRRTRNNRNATLCVNHASRQSFSTSPSIAHSCPTSSSPNPT